MDKEEEKLYSCAWCGKVADPDLSPCVAVCCSLPDELKGQFIKGDEGRMVNLMYGMKVINTGIPARDSEATKEGADLIFLCCSEECKETIEAIIEAGFLDTIKEES